MCKNPRYGIIEKNNGYSIMSNNASRAKLHWLTEEEYYKRTDKNNVTIIPCKKCRLCRLNKANEWATRCYTESITNTTGIFITLSYNNENLPKTEKGEPTLKKDDLRLFKNKLRQQLYRDTGERIKIKTFECGEYGQKKGRPHYHMILWGWKPKDLKPNKMNKNGDYLYSSNKLEKIWGKGLIIIGQITYESASYVARYTNKKIDEININPNIEKPFINMSRGKNNSIGIDYWKMKKNQIKENKGIYVKTNKGVKLKNIPNYFLKKWEEEITKKQKEELINTIPKEMYQDHIKLKKEQKETLENLKKTIKILELFEKDKIKEYTEKRKKYINKIKEKYHEKWRHEITKILNKNENWIKEYNKSELKKYKEVKKEIAIWQKKLILSKTSKTEKEYDKQCTDFIDSRNKLLKRSLEA